MSEPYKKHPACFSSRMEFMRSHPDEWPDHQRPAEGEVAPAPHCPDCKRPVTDMRLDFKTPARKDVEHWEMVEYLFGHGVW